MPGKYASSPYPNPTHTYSPNSLPPSPQPASTAVSGSAPAGCPCSQKAHRLGPTPCPQLVPHKPLSGATCCCRAVIPHGSPGLTMLWDSQAHKRMSSCWPLPGLSILHTPRKLPYLPLSGHPYLWAPPPPTLPTRCHLPSLNPQVQPSTVGALTSDPGPPLPTRECTFCLKPVFPSFAIGQPPPLNSGSSLSE